MMSSTLGAPLGGTMRGGHQGLDSAALCLITPPNCGGGGGICFPLMVVVALGDPSSPVTCCAATGVTASMAASRNGATAVMTSVFVSSRFTPYAPLLIQSESLLCRSRPPPQRVRVSLFYLLCRPSDL